MEGIENVSVDVVQAGASHLVTKREVIQVEAVELANTVCGD